MTKDSPEDLARMLAAVMRQDRGRMLAAVAARLGDLQQAEDAVQEAAASALVHWARSGPPDRPTAWLIRVAFRKAIDRLRGAKRSDATSAALMLLASNEAAEDPELIPDDRLRLIFTCCHPALDPKSRVALTLRTIAGLTTAEIARAFLDAEPTMGQRLTRAKAKIAAAGIPFAVPGPEEWPDRLQSVLAVVYLIFNAGYTSGPLADRDLCAEAVWLARLIDRLRPAEAEVEGCLALMLLTDARRAARTDAAGVSVPLALQNRRLWDHSAIAEGLALIDRAMARRNPGPYQIKAAIAACHVAADRSDWPQIAALYARLLQIEPTPVVRLNHAVAVAESGGLDAALMAIDAMSGALDDYQPYHAARADLLSRAGRHAESQRAFDQAIALAASSADAAFLIRQQRSRLTEWADRDKDPQTKKKAEQSLGPSPTGRYEGSE